MFAISIPSIVPTAVPSESAAPGSSVCTCTLSAVSSPTTSERVAELLELGLERLAVERVSLDHEDGAVAVARQLEVDRVEPRRLAGDLGRGGHGLAADGSPRRRGASSTRPGAARVDDARLAQNLELLGRAGDRVLPAPHELDEQLAERLGLAGARARPPRRARG